jgi:uncharacterized protein (UPF0262 family)
MSGEAPPVSSSRLVEIVIDEASLAPKSPEVDHERAVAIFDILEQNEFALNEGPEGPYKLKIAMAEQRLVFAICCAEDASKESNFILSLSPFRRVVKDYFMVCENYFEAIKSAPPSRIEALDMGRRALHDEGSVLLAERLAGKVTMDKMTARRLFTLICALHWRG